MRAARVLWLVVFLIPLGVLADRYCYFNFTDPVYHALMWLHERLPVLFLCLAAISAGSAIIRYIRIQDRLRALEALRSTPSVGLQRAFANVDTGRDAIDLVYIDVPSAFCFTVFGGRVVISRGFSELLDNDELRLVAEHEALHIRRGDPLRALLWHLLFAALIVPGFERAEEALYARRERDVDTAARQVNPLMYDGLVQRVGRAICGGTPGAAFRSLAPQECVRTLRMLAPAMIPIALLTLLVASHVLFVKNLPFLTAHHC